MDAHSHFQRPNKRIGCTPTFKNKPRCFKVLASQSRGQSANNPRRKRRCGSERSPEARPPEADNIDVGPVTEADLHDDLFRPAEVPF